MRLRKRIRPVLWFATPFALVLGVVSGAGSLLYPPDRATAPTQSQIATPLSPLLDRAISVEHLIEPKSRARASEGFMPDSAIVILLGGIGCSADQVKVLRDWSEPPPESKWRGYPVLAIYADPLLGEETSIYESLVLRRVSQAHFPFLVSRDSLFSPRDLGVRTPQVVLAESGVITKVVG